MWGTLEKEEATPGNLRKALEILWNFVITEKWEAWMQATWNNMRACGAHMGATEHEEVY